MMEPNALPASMIPQHGTLLLTWACNSRCTSCKIWEIYKDDHQAIRKEMVLEDYARLLSDPLFKNVTALGLAGGEPLMRRDLLDIVALIPSTVQIFIATNAITLGRIKQLLPVLQARGNSVVQISIDGIGAMHDRVRGVEGNYTRCLQVLDWLVEMKIPRVISSTVSPVNHKELPDLYRLAQQYGAGFAFRTANKGDFYDNIEDRQLYQWQPEQIETLKSEIAPIVADQLLRGEASDASGVFWNEIPNWLTDTLDMPHCLAAYKTFMIDPVGEVYPCPSWWHSLGNVKATSFSEVWTSAAASRVRAGVDALKCGGCWNDCTWPEVLTHEPEYVNPRVEQIRKKLAAEAARAAVPAQPITLFDKVFHRSANAPGVRPGAAEDAVYLAYGWYAIQDMPPPMRWTRDEAALFLIIPPKARHLSLRVLAMHPDIDKQPVEVEVCVEGQGIASRELKRHKWQTLQFDLPAGAGGQRKVILKVDRTWVPRQALGTTDSRELGIAVERVWSE